MTETEWLTCTDSQRMLGWLTGTFAEPNRNVPWKGCTNRKLRLFACACCIQVWDRLPYEVRQAVETAEQYAEGLITLGQLTPHSAVAEVMQLRRWEDLTVNDRDYLHTHEDEVWYALCWVGVATSKDMVDGGLNGTGIIGNGPILSTIVPPATQANLLRDIFGNPFRPVQLGHIVRAASQMSSGALDSGAIEEWIAPQWLAWNDRTVPRIAQATYDERAFNRMPILADALEEAGCTNEEILMHCRGQEFVDSRTWATQPLSGPHVRGCWVIDLLLGKE